MNKNAQQSILRNYQDLLGHTVGNVLDKIRYIEKKYSIPHNVIRNYLEVNEPDLYEAQIASEEKCNSDILRRISDGSATVEECIEWRDSLVEWQHLVVAGLNKYEDFQAVLNVA